MTAKAKPRKRPAKAAPVKPAPAGTPREVSEIERLFVRYKWLEADQIYQSRTASTEEECDKLLSVHDRELDKIINRLAELQPKTFHEMQLFLEYLNVNFRGARFDGMDKKMFANVLKSLFEVRRNIENDARAEAYGKAVKRTFEAALEITDLQSHQKRLATEPKITPASA
jgi:hypothetical protein